MKSSAILDLLKLRPSFQSRDFVQQKTQFHLHHLLTEKRHPLTWNLSFVIKKDIKAGLRQLLSVDGDISRKFNELAQDELFLSDLHQAVNSIKESISGQRRIFIYGCGSTGRLAKQMESALWRPFWEKASQLFLPDASSDLQADFLIKGIENRLIGEMTGGDRALVSALEGFEDLELIGRLQLREKGIQPEDVVICITEGGETSSVIGAMKEAWEGWEKLPLPMSEKIVRARQCLFFVYNNPDQVLLPLERSRAIINNPAITCLNLTTGPQAITGSTRMQAATSETFLVGGLLEAGIRGYLQEKGLFSRKLPQEERKIWAFSDFLRSFENLRQKLFQALEEAAQFVEWESQVYRQGGKTIYFARQALPTVFIDCAERSPTFHLHPLDACDLRRRQSWVQVWTEASSREEAWKVLLGRDFQGLDLKFYQQPFQEEIRDPYLRQVALASLAQASPREKERYDFSFSEKNVSSRGPEEGDLGIVVCFPEEVDRLKEKDSSWWQFIQLCQRRGARVGFILVLDQHRAKKFSRIEFITTLGLDPQQVVLVPLEVDDYPDLIGLRPQVLLKMYLNAHSTAVMAYLGRVVGNTMTYVNPSNLKLIGRATYLIQSQVNDILQAEEWVKKIGRRPLLTYEEANAVLFAALEWRRSHQEELSEVALAIVRILESFKFRKEISWEETEKILRKEGLESYLLRHKPSLGEVPLSFRNYSFKGKDDEFFFSGKLNTKSEKKSEKKVGKKEEKEKKNSHGV